METDLAQRLKERLPWLKEAGEIAGLVETWPAEEEPGAWVERIAELMAIDYVSGIHIDPNGSGGLLKVEVDGVSFAAVPLDAEAHEELLREIAARAGMDPDSAGQIAGDGYLWCEEGEAERDLLVTMALALEGPLVSINRARRQADKTAFMKDWPAQAIQVTQAIDPHPQGLILFCHRPWSAAYSTMQQWLIADASSESRSAHISDGPVVMPQSDNVFSMRVDSTRADWEVTINNAIALNCMGIGLAGRDDDETLRQSVLTAMNGSFTFTNTSRLSVIDSLLWAFSGRVIDPALVAQILVAVIGTVNLRFVCPKCAEKDSPDPALLARLAAAGINELPKGKWLRGKGCAACNKVGYTPPNEKLQPLVEAIYIDSELAQLCASQPGREVVLAAMRERGFRSYFDQAFELAQQGKTTLQEAVRVGLTRRAGL
jgi:MSHA biogenesis protein MshE